ncbi:MAG: Gamma-glutamyltranspeptidase @ Glutathione hydrolase [uncultured Solirubrobacteraceae bacterium]|uniref:Gamma-glutamyltranspeptidase @ Glutathione hydrolase n=1 Tax=uncultured Solirubrobacteraceae bacterium TaxID=1162706 RepID=A0A6J4S7T6_9ACTN|nr:MAG: Gamma-glutamyltranspeptidase @ Glutathione hydrolase [uncultured Solirubrobacteraceae bacterium]
MPGVIAAGHPVTADVGAQVLRDGGNGVDAAVAAMLASFVAEPLLTGLGAGGYMLVSRPGEAPVLLDFIVAAPGDGGDPDRRAPLTPVDVSFGDAVQRFHVGPSSCGVYGTPAGAAHAAARFGSRPLAELAAPAVALARDGVEVNAQQAYLFEILAAIIDSTPEARAAFAPHGRPPAVGERVALPDLADALALLGSEGPSPFYGGAVGHTVADWVATRDGALTLADLAGYRVIERDPLALGYRGLTVVTNPPPNAGGVLLAYALSLLDRRPGCPSALELVEAMRAAQGERTPEFVSGLDREGFADSFLATRLGSTTHISVLDGSGMACSVTCTNGEGSGVLVPGTGIHLNNMMGEEDLSPLGFFSHPPGRRLPSMMAPTMVLDDGIPQVVLGSAGSNRIRSALLQVIVGAVDGGAAIDAAVESPRVHYEDGIVYAEPGIALEEIEAAGHRVARFRAPNLFFGGVQAVARDGRTGALSAGADPRRGGAAVLVG